MPIRSKAKEAGVFDPDDLDLLARVFRDTEAPEEASADREDRALRLLGYFTAGIRNEAQLRNLIRQPQR